MNSINPKSLLFFVLPFLLYLYSNLASALSSKDLLPAEKAFPVTAHADSQRIRLHWDIASGYYLYRDKFKLTSATPGVILGEATFPAGAKKQDEFFGEMEIYRGGLDLELPLKERPPSISAIELNVSVQGCADAGVCYPPYRQKLSITLDTPSPSLLSRLQSGIKLRSLTGSPDLLPANEAFRFYSELKSTQTLNLNWQIADGYYLYRDKFRFTLKDSAGIELGDHTVPHGEEHDDPEFGRVEILRGDLNISLPLLHIDPGATHANVLVSYQGCADRGVCYPPMQQTVQIDLPAQSSNAHPPKPKVISEQDRIASALESDSIFVTVMSFLGFGVLLSFTPCVFPMIPILSGIIVGHGHTITIRRGFFLSLSYVIASALAYTVFGVLAGLFGSNLQAAFQEPAVIASFSVLFVVLALAMFDLYTLQMPGFIQNVFTGWSQKQSGGTFLGAAIMGALSALIVGPCIAAPLAGALIYIGQTGNALLGGVALFSLGIGMGAPLLVIGASAGKLLPRAGLWMNAVKSAFGVLLLATAVWLLSRILDPAITLLLCALLLIIPAVYLGALDPLPHPASGWKKFFKGMGVVMLVYGVLLLIGVASRHTDPLHPLQDTNPSIITAGAAQKLQEPGLPFRPISTLGDLYKAQEQATASGQWIMLDFYADWCVSCKELEHYTFTDPNVQKALEKAVLLKADITRNTDDDQLLLRHFGLIGPPAILFFGPDKNERKDFRVVGFMDSADFLGHVEMVMQSCVQTC